MSALLEARGLTKTYPTRGRAAGGGRDASPALADIDLTLERGETLAVVGESGSGKSTLGRCLLRLVEPTSGQVRFDGIELGSLRPRDLRRLRRRFQMVFQDPEGSLDPRMAVGTALAEPISAHRIVPPGEEASAVSRLLERVGLPAEAAARLPHQFSGGQRQRIAIARALATDPELVVADEPVSSLDVSVRAQIVNLLAELQAERGLALLFIAHDLALVEQLADRVAVLYRGRMVECAARAEIFGRPRHPYTAELLASVPSLDRRGESELRPAGGEAIPPAPTVGCSYRGRCPAAAAVCEERRPDLRETEAGHLTACHFPDSIQPDGLASGMRRNFSGPIA